MSPIASNLAVFCLVIFAWTLPSGYTPTRAHLLQASALHSPKKYHPNLFIDNVQEEEEAGGCACVASYNYLPPSQLSSSDCGNPPLIEPSSPSTKNGECKTSEDGNCQAIAGSNCEASINVRVTFPSSGNTCHNVWIMGGAAHPNPTMINATSLPSKLTAKQGCGMTSATTGGSANFYVWKTQPVLNADGTLLVDVNGDPGTAPAAKLTLNVKCDPCDKIDD